MPCSTHTASVLSSDGVVVILFTTLVYILMFTVIPGQIFLTLKVHYEILRYVTSVDVPHKY